MIVCFEGVSCTGKSTLIAEVCKIFKNSKVISELPKNYYRYKNLDTYCRKNDELKCKKALAITKTKIVLLDRGPASTLAYNYIQYKLKISDEYLNTLNWYIRATLEKKLVKPDLYIFIEADNKTVINRAKSIGRYKKEIAWYQEPSIGNQFYKKFFKKYEADVPVIKINAMQNLNTNTKKVVKAITDKIN